MTDTLDYKILTQLNQLYDIDHYDNFDSIDEWMKWEDETFEWIEEMDRQAEERGHLVGRYFRRPVADGHALYVIIMHDETTELVRLMTIPLNDAWEDGTIAAMNNMLPESAARIFIEQEHVFDKYRNKKVANE